MSVFTITKVKGSKGEHKMILGIAGPVSLIVVIALIALVIGIIKKVKKNINNK